MCLASVRCGCNYTSVCHHYFLFVGIIYRLLLLFSVCPLLRDFGYIPEIFSLYP